MIMKNSNINNHTIGSAAVQCASKKGKLISFNNCQSLDAIVNDLQEYDGIIDEKFWLGMFAPGKMNKKSGYRNFVEDGKDWIIDSYDE